MDIRSCIRYLGPGDRLSIDKLWDVGRTEMDLAYNAATARPITFEFALDEMSMVFFFVGGRSSLIRYFADRSNLRRFWPIKGGSLGLIFDRKQHMLKKNKTMVGVCNLQIQTLYPVHIVKAFIGRPGVLPLDSDGANLTTAQLSSILHYYFRDPERERRQVVGALEKTGLW